MNTDHPPPGPWASQAACARQPGLPWTLDTDQIPTRLVDLMAGICAACPVRTACDNYTHTTHVDGGFWAGQDRSAVHQLTLFDGAA